MPNGFNKFNNDNQPPKKEQVSEPVPFSESVPSPIPPKPQIKIKTVIQEVVTVKQGDQGEPGMRGLRGLRGITGPKGDTGDTGKQGKQGERGEKGEAGSQGVKGTQGVSGVAGSSGEKGEKGDAGQQGLKGDSGTEGVQGAQGEVGEKGERGEKGEQGEQGEEGAKGDIGEKGEQGESGIDGVDGQDGLLGQQGERGEDGLPGPQGERGEKGSIGLRGEKGEAGVRGEDGVTGLQGATGERGATGDSGIVLAKYPLRYDPKKKIISIDTTRLGGGGSVSKDGGGGGLDTAFKTISVSGQSDLNAVQYDAEILSIVAGSNITLTTDSATNSLTISSSGGGGTGNGAQGATGADGVQGTTGTTGTATIGFRYLYNSNIGLSAAANLTGQAWFQDGNGMVYVHRITNDGIDAYGHLYSWKSISGWPDNGMLMIKRHGEVSPMRMVSFTATQVYGSNIGFQYNVSNGGVSAGSIFTNGELLDIYIMALQGPQGSAGTPASPILRIDGGTYQINYEAQP